MPAGSTCWPSRCGLRLLDRLRDGEATVQQLVDELETSQQSEPSQQNVPEHLMLLTDAAMLARRKHGTHVRYRIGDPEILGLCEQMCESAEHQLRRLAALVDDLGDLPAAGLNEQVMKRGEPR